MREPIRCRQSLRRVCHHDRRDWPDAALEMNPRPCTLTGMAMSGGFVLDSEWYWRIFEGEATFGEHAGATAARDFLRPLSQLARDRVAIDEIAVDPDGDGVSFRIAERPIAVRCRDLRVDRFVELINRSLADAELDLAIAIVESRRYELRCVLGPRGELPRRSYPRGTLPP
jgi:hypothetical protein